MGHSISRWLRFTPEASKPSPPVTATDTGANVTFSLERCWDKLPASVFLWSDRVPEGSKAEYFQRVGELYQLFLTPLNYREKQVSFLKLYEKRFANKEENYVLKNEIIRLLKHHNSALFIGLAKIYIRLGHPIAQANLFDQLDLWL